MSGLSILMWCWCAIWCVVCCAICWYVIHFAKAFVRISSIFHILFDACAALWCCRQNIMATTNRVFLQFGNFARSLNSQKKNDLRYTNLWETKSAPTISTGVNGGLSGVSHMCRHWRVRTPNMIHIDICIEVSCPLSYFDFEILESSCVFQDIGYQDTKFFSTVFSSTFY